MYSCKSSCIPHVRAAETKRDTVRSEMVRKTHKSNSRKQNTVIISMSVQTKLTINNQQKSEKKRGGEILFCSIQ